MKKPTKRIKKILILFCGGSISMHKDEKTGALQVAFGVKQLFQIEPRIIELANISTAYIANIDSTNFDHRHWEKIVKKIAQNYKKYDGFVVTMGTNTMAYASSAVSFALANIGKPVIFTGSQIPAEIISTDSRNNLVNAVRVATMELGGVFVVFGSKIILGSRAKKVSESDLDAFHTFNDTDFGEIGVGITLNKDTHRAHSQPLVVKNGFDDNIVCYTLVPGFRPEFINRLIRGGVKGIVLRAYGSGDIPYSLLPSLQYAKKRRLPVVVTTQCPGGATVMGLNDVGLKALKSGVIQAFDMSMETMTTKLMWLIKQRYPYRSIRRLMHKNYTGEISKRKAELILHRELT